VLTNVRTPHLVAAVEQVVDGGVERGLVVEAEAGLVDHVGGVRRRQLGVDAQLVEDVLVRVLLLGGDPVARMDDDRGARGGRDDAGRDAEDRGASLAVVVGAAVDGVGVGFGVFDALAHHVDVRAEFLGRVPLPAVREPERPERGRVGLVREDALERLGRLRARQVVGRLVAGAADIGHQPFEGPVAELLSRLSHTRRSRPRTKSPSLGSRVLGRTQTDALPRGRGPSHRVSLAARASDNAGNRGDSRRFRGTRSHNRIIRSLCSETILGKYNSFCR